MKFIKWLLLTTILYIIFFLIKPINDNYSHFAGLVIGNIGQFYWYKYFIKGDKDE